MARKILFCVFLVLSVVTFFTYAGEVKMTTYYPAPYGEYKKIVTKKLEVNSAADETPMTIKANSTQSNTNPLLKFLKSDGTELLRIHSDDPYNVFIGTDAGKSNNRAGGKGAFNTFIGNQAGRDTTTGGTNLAVGTCAYRFNTTGSDNMAIGPFAMENNTTGRYNTGVGIGALNVNAVAYGNSAVGICALNQTAGQYNTALGAYTGFYLTSGSYNTFIGGIAGYALGPIGQSAQPITGSSNTFLGYYTGTNVNQKGDAVNSMALGANTYTTADNQVVIGDSNITQTLLRGNVGIGTASPSATLEVNGNISMNEGGARTISIEQSSAIGPGDNLIIHAGKGRNAGYGANTGGNLYLTGGDADVAASGGGAVGGGSVYIYPGSSAGTPTADGNIILGHTGTSQRGKVGIGTGAPTATLDVNGTLKISNWAEQSLGLFGSYVRVGSILIQEGESQSTKDGPQKFFFPIPFPGSAANIQITRIGANIGYPLGVSLLELDGFTIDRNDGMGNNWFYWVAIGT